MWLKFPAGATPFKVGRELGVWCLMTSFQERTKAIKLSCRSVIQLLRVSVLACLPRKNQPIHPFEREIFSYSMNYKYMLFTSGRSVLGKTVPDILDIARGRRPRAVSKTEGTVFPNTDRPSAGE